MPKYVPSSLSLSVEGKNVEIHHDTSKVFDLNKALTDQTKFKQFANDPKAFAAQYGLTIDHSVAGQLKTRLAGLDSLADVQSLTGGDGGDPATVWAIAAGSFSISSTKIAVAF
jgi:hypothetical protein